MGTARSEIDGDGIVTVAVVVVLVVVVVGDVAVLLLHRLLRWSGKLWTSIQGVLKSWNCQRAFVSGCTSSFKFPLHYP
jgi:hypothetical protein